jgi:hypothetical protein
MRLVIGLPTDFDKIDRNFGWSQPLKKPELQETSIIFHLYNVKKKTFDK